MTEAELAAIEARAKAATLGPWKCDYIPGARTLVVKRGSWVVAHMAHFTGPEHHERDGAFIAAARSDVPALLTEVRRLRAGLREIATSLPAHADGACCFQDQGYRCKCDIADVQRLIVDLLHIEAAP